jgi:pimeloyl-ACP methyl ester carboxylesterase
MDHVSPNLDRRLPMLPPSMPTAHSRLGATGCRRVAPWAALLLLLAGCGTPIQVERIDPRDVQRELTSNVISTDQISPDTQIVLERQNLWQLYENNPETAIAILHRTAMAGEGGPDVLFALAEMSFRYAEHANKRPYYLAATIYAFAFLFPNEPAQRPNEFDPRIRIACDIYNRSLTSAFATADRSRVVLSSGTFELPFGTIDVTFDSATARWDDLTLSDFTPADELRVEGLRSIYRQYGIGASLAADASSVTRVTGFQASPDLKVPVTALLRIDLAQRDFAEGHLHGRIDVYPAYEPTAVEVRGQSVPLQADPTAAFAYGLSDPDVWGSEYSGFLHGDFFDRSPSQLVGAQPYDPDEIPVVFIHGTASSAGRWADLINDLQSDPVIRDHYQFWSFTYSTGNPVWYSALLLRRALESAVQQLDPQGKNPALHDMVLIGHSQGGLLAKMMVVDSGSRLWDAFSSKPLDQLRVSEQTRELLRQAFFVKPLPEVRRVIFIATPHHGSFVAESWIGQLIARLVTLPIGLTRALTDLVQGNIDALRINRSVGGFGSVWSMTPGNPVLQALAATPISRNVTAHSIIAVQGNGPIETGSDGVVTYRSAHIDDVASELVVRSGHSVQAAPQTVAEVRRILLLHLAETCPHGCSPVSMAGGPLVAFAPTIDGPHPQWRALSAEGVSGATR